MEEELEEEVQEEVPASESTNPRRPFYTERFKTLFEKKYRKNTNGCWVWTAYRDDDDYGQVRVGTLGVYGAHRVSYELYTGEDIPDTDENGEKMDIDHTCHIRRCVWPEHLTVVPHSKNMKNLRKPTEDWDDDVDKKFKEERTTPEEVLDAALALIAECKVEQPPIFAPPGVDKGYAIITVEGAPWRTIAISEGFLPQDKYSLVKMFLDVLRFGVDWRVAAREILGVSAFTVQNWRANGDFREEMDECRAEGRKYRLTVLEDKHMDEIERKMPDADFKDVADSLEKLRRHDPANKKAEQAAAAGGGITIVFNTGDQHKALREMIDVSDAIEAEFEVKD